MQQKAKPNGQTEILVVEDSNVEASLLRRMLSMAGYRVSVASDGTQALKIVQQQKPDLIISDIVMPTMDGYEMCHHIKHDEALKDIPIILLTQLAEPEDVIKGINAKADCYVTKPYKRDFLQQKIEDLQANSAARKSHETVDTIDVYLHGHAYSIENADPKQILTLMISIYDSAVQQRKELMQRTAELKASEESYRQMLENTLSGFYRATLEGELIEVNPAYVKMLGSPSKAALLNVQLASALYTSQADYQDFIEELMQQGALKNHIVHLHKRDGSEIIVEENVSLVRDRHGAVAYYEGFVNDITDRIRMENLIRHQAFHDSLTGLPNRVLFFDRLNQAVTRARRERHMLAVVFIDLDGFKDVNDTYGHEVGDELLKCVAMRLQKCLRQSDTVARLGGDEFIVLASPIAELRSVDAVAQRIISTLTSTWHINDHDGQITASLGIALYPEDTRDADTLIRHADTAMYYAKAHGKNAYELYANLRLLS